MLSTIVVVLLLVWLLGVATSYTMGGILHLLLVVAIAAALLRLVHGPDRSADNSAPTFDARNV